MYRTIDTAPEKQLVMTKISDDKGDRCEQIMLRRGRLWFAGDDYVYYEPTHWRALTDIEKMRIKNDEERKAIDRLEKSQKLLKTMFGPGG